MRALNPATDLQSFFDGLAHAPECVLLVDYDAEHKIFYVTEYDLKP